ncbi:hypothetical protein GH714_040247 [Hevea brasiliensis]|uniref:Hemerythrin-like domain-containing protein n=1 Tax=Hevea brasiliensis TaxID=3981 RepID=A0A6A6MTS6_HEVBR|nr:hypothetical protein GH714_040247 [Hevea brasiliensis]
MPSSSSKDHSAIEVWLYIFTKIVHSIHGSNDSKILVFPLLIEKFSLEEQSSLIWQFVCSIPVDMVAELLPWLASSISPVECQDMHKCLSKIIPEEKLLQQIIFTWMEGRNGTKTFGSCINNPQDQYCTNSTASAIIHEFNNVASACEQYKIGKRKYMESSNDASDTVGTHPINEILFWHNAIKRELNEIAEEARKIQLSGDFTNISDFDDRLQFIAEVCIFHSIGEDKVIFPAIDGEFSFFQEHGEEESQFNEFKCLIESIQMAGANSNSAADFYAKLCLHADQMMETIQRHFYNEEVQKILLDHGSAFASGFCSKDRAVSLCGDDNKRPAKRNTPVSCKNSNAPNPSGTLSSHEPSCTNQSCCVPGLGVINNNLGLSSLSTTKSLRSLSFSSYAPALNSSLFVWEADNSSSDMGYIERPIDIIFKFHKAISKDLENLDIESGKLSDCDETLLQQFTGRFRLLWGFYRAHSNAEDDIVFPALESKEALHNVSHSYMLDHKQEEKLFEDFMCAF